MGHNDGTQSPSNPMPKHPHIFKRDGRYYYRRRIPADLVAAKCYGRAKEKKRALKTGELSTANQLAMRIALELDLEFDAKRREIGLASLFAKSANPSESSVMPRLLSLLDEERRNFIIRAFITNEKGESKVRSFESDSVTRETKLEFAREDLAALEGSPRYAEINWLSVARKALKADGILIDGTLDDPSLQSIADMLRRATVENAWRTERAISGSAYDSRDPYFDAFHGDSPMPTPPKAHKTIGDLRQRYLADANERKIAPSTIKWKEQSARVMAEFFGETSALSSITRDDAFQLVSFLPTIPSNAAKRFKNRSIVEAATLEAKKNNPVLLSPKTVKHYFEGIFNIFKFALAEDWVSENPLDRQAVRERLPKALEVDKRPLAPDEMTTMFSSPKFLSQKNLLEIRYWLPLLCLFHGTRANEMAGIRVADIKESEGIFYLNVRAIDEQRVKTDSSVRKVPLHPKIVEFGFLDFVAKRREISPDGYLFSGVTRNKNGSMADAVGKWWARLVIKLLGPPDFDWPQGSRGIHSFRHSWVAAARTAEIQEGIWERITGHSSGKKVSRRYGRHGELPLLKTAIDKIEFPNVDFSALFQPKADQ